jgi:hypothetical protein
MALAFKRLAAGLAMAFLSACASMPPTEPAKQKTECELEAESFRSQVLAIPEVRLHEVLTGRKLRLLLESLGNPAEGDQMIVMNLPSAPTYFAILLKDGCMTARGEIPKEQYDRFKRGASI